MWRRLVPATTAAAATVAVIGATDDGSNRVIRQSWIYWKAADVGAWALRQINDAEDAHAMTLKLLELGLAPVAPAAPKELRTEFLGLEVLTPIGVAAGFDKKAQVLKPLKDMGFGFVEVGGVTLSAEIKFQFRDDFFFDFRIFSSHLISFQNN